MSTYIHPDTCGCPEHRPDLALAQDYIYHYRPDWQDGATTTREFFDVCDALADIWNTGVAQVGSRSVRMTNFEAAEDLLSALFYAVRVARVENAAAVAKMTVTDSAEDELRSAFAYWHMLPSHVQNLAIATWLSHTGNGSPVFQATDEARRYVIERACRTYGYADSQDATFGSRDDD
jgi:hypothetical protein